MLWLRRSGCASATAAGVRDPLPPKGGKTRGRVAPGVRPRQDLLQAPVPHPAGGRHEAGASGELQLVPSEFPPRWEKRQDGLSGLPGDRPETPACCSASPP